MTITMGRRGALGLLAGGALAPHMALAEARTNPMPDSLRQALERDPGTPVLGNPKGDVTLTEFMDYNCPHCRTMLPVMKRALAADRGLRLVMRDWPVFGEGSWFAARAALAAHRQGRYWDLHQALLTGPRAEEASVMRAVRKLGLDEARLKADMEGEAVNGVIDGTMALADHMQLVGTPSFIAGDDLVFGEVKEAELGALTAKARRLLRG